MSTGLLIIIVIVVLLVAVAAVAIIVFRRMMGQPMYRPGMVREGKNLRGSLTPPEQPAEPEWWAMEEDIRLHHFAEGEGRNVVVVHGGPGYPYRPSFGRRFRPIWQPRHRWMRKLPRR